MALPPGRPLADPLLEPDAGPRDASGAPVRAPIGNSIRTLLLFGALLIVGVVVWWFSRPDDLTERIGGREWAIVDIDGEPAVNVSGTVSTFVLDGTHEVRGVLDCNTRTGRWAFDTSSQRLDVDWDTVTSVGCADWPNTYSVASGTVRFDGGTMSLDTGGGEIRSIALGDMEIASADELAGQWTSGSTSVELGSRGLVRVDGCTGSWMAVGTGISVGFEESVLRGCELAPIWTGESIIVPIRFEDSLYLHHALSPFPLDRAVYRLDLKAPPPG
jgi:hypothetical protein